MATINVLDSSGSVVAIEKPLTPGRAAAASSRPVALSSEDYAAIDGIETALALLHTDLGALAGYVDGLEGLLGKSATGTQSSVAGSATDVTILASNSSRNGGSIYNDSTAILYLLLASGTSSTSNFSVKLVADAYFEIPAGYTGVVKGIWASATGSARVTEFA